MNTTDILLTVILLVCIGLSGFFSGSETAFVAFPRERVPRREDQSRWSPWERRIFSLVDQLEMTLGTLLIANNFVNILGASTATILAIRFLETLTTPASAEVWGPWLATAVVTAVILVVGEITPKTLASRHPERFARVVSAPIFLLSRVLYPLAVFFLALGRGVLRLLGAGRLVREGASEKDVLALAALGEREGDIERTELDIINSLFDLADRPIRDVMTPRVEVLALEGGTTVKLARRKAAEWRHSRFPVTVKGAGLDEILGILYVKDLLGETHSDRAIDGYVRHASFMPERMTVLAALDQMRREKIGVALVLDEHGGVDGMVTLKDLIAELVGEIVDEDDPEEPTVVTIGMGEWVVDGRVTVEALSDEIGFRLPEGPYSTVGGMFLAAAGKVPAAGNRLEVAGVVFNVVKMDRHRIERLRVTLNPHLLKQQIAQTQTGVEIIPSCVDRPEIQIRR